MTQESCVAENQADKHASNLKVCIHGIRDITS